MVWLRSMLEILENGQPAEAAKYSTWAARSCLVLYMFYYVPNTGFISVWPGQGEMYVYTYIVHASGA